MKSIKKLTALILASSVFMLASCNLSPAITNPSTTAQETSGGNEATSGEYSSTQAPSTDADESSSHSEATASPETGTTTPVQQTTTAPVSTTATTPSTTAEANTEVNYSSYTKKQVIDEYAKALNKTRAYTGELTIHHKEDFNFEVLEATPGGSLTTRLINYIVGLVVKPSETDYKFSGGKAQNEDGESIPILLPQKNDFSLPESGVASASAESANGMLHITIRLNPEEVGLGEAPACNSTAVGFLDTSSFSFSLIEINSCTINYSGSVIDAYVRADGYIDSVTYTINMTTSGNVTGFGISGGGVIEGAQTEVWSLKW